MNEALVATLIVALLALLPLLVLLIVRRAVLAARDRRFARAEARLRPVAIALVEETDPDLPALSESDQAVLAQILGRYSRKLTGDADTRIGAYFRSSAALSAAVADLR